MKKIYVALLITALFILSGCSLLGGKKTFTENGVSVKLDRVYRSVTKDFTGFNMVLEGPNSVFMANIEAKSDFTVDYTLSQYTNLVLTGRSHSDIEHYTEGDIEFYYCTYEGEAEGILFKYLLVTKMNDDNYMTCNFYSPKSKFDNFYDKFLEAAQTIEFVDEE